MVVQAIADLVRWQLESDVPLPLREFEIASMEQRGVIVELCGGGKFVQHESWGDFAERWVVEMQRRGEMPSEERLARAIGKANESGWSMTFCRAVAHKVLPLALVKVGVCSVQLA